MRKKVILFLITFIISFSFKIYCEDEGMQRKISLDLRNIDVVDALKFLAMKANINIVTSKKVSGRVNLTVKDVPIKDVFDIMLRSNGLAYDKKGEIYNIMTEEEYESLYGKKFSDTRQVKVFHLKYAIPEQVFSLCDALKSEIGRVVVDPESGAVVLMDSPQKIKEIEEAIKRFEKENIVKVFNINYADAKEIAKQLKNQLDAKKVGMVRADERSNQVIVQTLPNRMKQVEEIIKRLDKKTKEVLIDTKIIKVKFTKDITESVEWEGLFDIARKHGLTYLGSYPFSAVQSATDAWRSRKEVFNTVGYVGSYPFSGTTSNFSASSPTIGTKSMHIGIIGKHDFDMLIKYFQDIGETQIISTPKIVVTNNQEARIHVGEKQAYVTTTTTTGQTTSTVSEEVTFVDVGTQLYVTPTINEEGYITLKVKAEVSNVVDVLITPTNNKIPIIDTSMAETTVMTKNGVTVVIGGLRKIERGNQITRVPILSSIPFLGRFFTSKAPTKARTELLIMLTPHLITGEVLVGLKGKEAEKKLIKSLKEYSKEEKKEEVKINSEKKKIKGLKE
jgi:type II secretory pathway component GspD/PulD (secretin)